MVAVETDRVQFKASLSDRQQRAVLSHRGQRRATHTRRSSVKQTSSVARRTHGDCFHYLQASSLWL